MSSCCSFRPDNDRPITSQTQINMIISDGIVAPKSVSLAGIRAACIVALLGPIVASCLGDSLD